MESNINRMEISNIVNKFKECMGKEFVDKFKIEVQAWEKILPDGNIDDISQVDVVSNVGEENKTVDNMEVTISNDRVVSSFIVRSSPNLQYDIKIRAMIMKEEMEKVLKNRSNEKAII